jgi:hypothetical protein
MLTDNSQTPQTITAIAALTGAIAAVITALAAIIKALKDKKSAGIPRSELKRAIPEASASPEDCKEEPKTIDADEKKKSQFGFWDLVLSIIYGLAGGAIVIFVVEGINEFHARQPKWAIEKYFEKAGGVSSSRDYAEAWNLLTEEYRREAFKGNVEELKSYFNQFQRVTPTSINVVSESADTAEVTVKLELVISPHGTRSEVQATHRLRYNHATKRWMILAIPQ